MDSAVHSGYRHQQHLMPSLTSPPMHVGTYNPTSKFGHVLSTGTVVASAAPDHHVTSGMPLVNGNGFPTPTAATAASSPHDRRAALLAVAAAATSPSFAPFFASGHAMAGAGDSARHQHQSMFLQSAQSGIVGSTGFVQQSVGASPASASVDGLGRYNVALNGHVTDHVTARSQVMHCGGASQFDIGLNHRRLVNDVIGVYMRESDVLKCTHATHVNVHVLYEPAITSSNACF
jgi:hypothetical protein